MEKPSISFDSDGKVRVLEADKYKATEELEKEARAFLASEYLLRAPRRARTHARTRAPLPASRAYAEIQEFSATVHAVVDNLGAQAARIEHAKLKVREAPCAVRRRRTFTHSPLTLPRPRRARPPSLRTRNNLRAGARVCRRSASGTWWRASARAAARACASWSR